MKSHPFVHGIEQSSIPLFTLPSLLLGCLALADVNQEAFDPGNPAAINHGTRREAMMPNGSVPPQPGKLATFYCLAPYQAFYDLFRPGQVRPNLKPGEMLADGVFPRVSHVHPQPRRVHVVVAPVHSYPEVPGIGVVDDFPESLALSF